MSEAGGYALAGSLGAIALLLMVLGTASLVGEERRLALAQASGR